ncbi:hydroxyacylglutathione hydrolase [Undibacterium parvum]|uniref:Hydroxyacylglutathione hydrolase n=1 Tax=Undibacterium parvum TaxID=401471 RepID=A0A3Q9BRX9_9BURK|nr:hydroxyacylglutathione hydrolase [Undibacterium parvum]AZP13090.1 hydroxyacylglutathione hydrolase [Undibacterium parvum]
MKNSLSILTVPAFDDNYLWIIHDGQHAVVVDPGDATPILAALTLHRLQLSAILLTHHHADHVGGVPALLQYAAVPVYGPKNDNIAAVTHPLGQDDKLTIEVLGLTLHIIDVPGHTAGHIAYFAPEQHWLFCGDTLFAGGCGRLFEGSPKQMLASLDKLAALPDDTLVHCAHEYTLSNLRFALALEPENSALRQRMLSAQSMRQNGLATVPSVLALEKQTNPFLRSRVASIRKGLLVAGKHPADGDEVSYFAAIREWKNNFA